MALLRNLIAAARPLADERPFEPLVRPRHIAAGERCVITVESTSCHPVITAQPLRFDDAAKLVDHLRRDGISVFRLAFAEQATARRILDFLCGAAMIQQGGLYRIASQTYLLTPRGVTVDEPLLRELERYGLYTRDSEQLHRRLA